VYTYRCIRMCINNISHDIMVGSTSLSLQDSRAIHRSERPLACIALKFIFRTGGDGEMIYKNPSPTNKTDVIYRARVRRPINRSAEPLVVVHDRGTHNNNNNNIIYLRRGPPPSTDRLSSVRVRTSATMSADSRAHKFTRATHHYGFAPITQILYYYIVICIWIIIFV